MNKIRIEISGRNNEAISNIEFSIKNKEISEEIKKFLYENKANIAKTFLEKMDNKGIVNSAIGVSKKNEKHPLWTYYQNQSYFGGVVGVIEDSFILKLSDEQYVGTQEIAQSFHVEQIELEIRLQIRSRFDKEKPYFLATMLLKNKLKLNDNMVLSKEEDLYDYLLLFWYKTKLQEAYEKGFYKTYRRFEANGDRLRGSIDISRHIKLNAGQNNGKIAFSYRENTVNNFLNHLIIAAYEYLKKKYPDLIEQNIDNDLDFRSILEGIKSEIGYDLLESSILIMENNKPISHPYFMEYEDLRVICLKILRDEGLSIWETEKETTKSILFYIPDLWEIYLEDKLREDSEISKDLYAQGCIPETNEAIKVFGRLDAKENSKFAKTTFPDFVFFDKKTPYFILDAKFRKGWETGISNDEKDSTISDWHDYDKCIRDMNSINAHATGIIFPTNKQPEDGKEYFGENALCHKMSFYNNQDIFYTFPVVVPQISVPSEKESGKVVELKYSEWKKEFDKRMNLALEQIKKKMILERKYSENLRKYFIDHPFPQREVY